MQRNAKEPVPDDVFIRDANRIVEEAGKRGAILRIIGALAIRIHSEESIDLHRKLGRLGEEGQRFSDIDLMAYRKQEGKVRELLEKELGYQIDRYILVYFGKNRQIYYHPKGWYHIDVFFDKLQFSHDIYFGSEPGKGRLEIDCPTITLADILLEKTQIHEISEKDVKDIIVLLRAHEIGEMDEKEVINAKYVAKVLANDWGFWYDVRINLSKVNALTEKYHKEGLMTREDLTNVKGKIAKVLRYIDEEPKTRNWEKRAAKGTEKQWWREVEEVVR